MDQRSGHKYLGMKCVVVVVVVYCICAIGVGLPLELTGGVV